MRVSLSASTARQAPEPPRGTGWAPQEPRAPPGSMWTPSGACAAHAGGHTPAAPRPWTKGRGSPGGLCRPGAAGRPRPLPPHRADETDGGDTIVLQAVVFDIQIDPRP